MKTVEFTRKAEERKIILEVPEEFEGKELRILISVEEANEEDPEKWHLLPSAKKMQLLKQYQGSAKFPDVEINKYDVYEQ